MAKVHKPGVPLRPVLSLPGSCYEKLTKSLNTFFNDIKEGQIETSSEEIKGTLREVQLAGDERLVSLDVKSLHTNVPTEEAIQLAVQLVYKKPEPPPVEKRHLLNF